MSSDPVPTIKEMEQAFHDAKVDYLVSTLPLTPEEEEALDEIERQQHYRELAAGGGQSAVPADERLYIPGVFLGADSLRRLAESDEFWSKEPYGTRLYFGDGVADYLHRDVLRAAVRALRAQPAAAPMPTTEFSNLLAKAQQHPSYWEERIAFARDAALEEAARACEARIGQCEPGLEGSIQDVDGEAQQCAAAIRALKGNSHE